MLVVVFNNGVEHKVKNCTKFSMPNSSYFGSILNKNGINFGTIYNKTCISLAYLTDDEDETYKKQLNEKCNEIKVLTEKLEQLENKNIVEKCNLKLDELDHIREFKSQLLEELSHTVNIDDENMKKVVSIIERKFDEKLRNLENNL